MDEDLRGRISKDFPGGETLDEWLRTSTTVSKETFQGKTFHKNEWGLPGEYLKKLSRGRESTRMVENFQYNIWRNFPGEKSTRMVEDFQESILRYFLGEIIQVKVIRLPRQRLKNPSNGSLHTLTRTSRTTWINTLLRTPKQYLEIVQGTRVWNPRPESHIPSRAHKHLCEPAVLDTFILTFPSWGKQYVTHSSSTSRN